MKISENVYKIHGEGNVYIYLGEEPFVIDTGNFQERENILARIKEIVDPDSIKYVFLTHLHFDHSGNVNLFPNAQIYASEVEIEDYKSNPEWFFFGKVPAEISHCLKKLKPLPKKILNLRVEKVPGHTRGSVYFVDEDKKLLFSGDTVFHNGVGRTDFENSAPDQMMDSIKKIYGELRENKLELHPGHDY